MCACINKQTVIYAEARAPGNNTRYVRDAHARIQSLSFAAAACANALRWVRQNTGGAAASLKLGCSDARFWWRSPTTALRQHTVPYVYTSIWEIELQLYGAQEYTRLNRVAPFRGTSERARAICDPQKPGENCW